MISCAHRRSSEGGIAGGGLGGTRLVIGPLTLRRRLRQELAGLAPSHPLVLAIAVVRLAFATSTGAPAA